MKIYLVGGAVRDEILGALIKDRDWVVVDSSPEEMIEAGFKQVGADFPVFLHPETGEEYALARVERKTGDGYHGFTVDTKGVTIEDDLSRRDLTINSMAREWTPEGLGPIIDPFKGQSDLQYKELRHTSDAFIEDPLRVVRLARFAARYSEFCIAPETERLAIKMIKEGHLDHIPYERYWAEMQKVMVDQYGDPGRFFQLLFSWGVRENVQFFHDVFGGPPKYESHSNCIYRTANITKTHVKEDLRLSVLVAIVGRQDFLPIMGSSTEMVKLHANLWAARKAGDISNPTQRAEATFELMKIAKPWGEGPHYDNLVTATRVIEMNAVPALCSHRLEVLRLAINQVKAEQFPHLQGKELGQAIEAARRKAVETTL